MDHAPVGDGVGVGVGVLEGGGGGVPDGVGVGGGYGMLPLPMFCPTPRFKVFSKVLKSMALDATILDKSL